MKKERVLLLILSFLLAFSPLTACAGKEPANGTAAVTTAPDATPETTPETAPETTPAETGPADGPVLSPDELALLKKNYPRTDGSTSTLPLDNAIREAICGPDYTPASHSTTHTAFYRLIHKSRDLIFSVPISPEQEKQAKDADVTIEQYAISKEAFVFVLNAENPVDALTQDQLRRIYSGKITNWKEVGGDDAPITAFQRNEDSGSQNYIKTFMGDTPLMDAPSTMRPGSMGALMDAIALYDNAKYSIGYSYYAYAANMYGTGTELKFVAVDGVYPDEATIADDTYPLLPRNYAIIRGDAPQTARDLVRWILSPEGQKIVAENGYFSLGGEGTLPPLAAPPEQVFGTGPELPETPPVLDRRYVAEWNPEGGCLKDQGVEEKLNAVYRQLKEEEKESVSAVVLNGYFLISYRLESHSYTRVFDLRTGEEITEVSDLFYKGTDFMKKIRETVPPPTEETSTSYDTITMSTLFGDSVDSFRVKEDYYGFSQKINPLYFLPMAPDAMEGLWQDPSAVEVSVLRLYARTGYRSERGKVAQFDEEDGLSAADRERINRFVSEYIENEENYARICEAYYNAFVTRSPGAVEQFTEHGQPIPESFCTPDQFDLAVVGWRYLMITAQRIMINGVTFYFDLDTLTPLDGAPDLTGVFA